MHLHDSSHDDVANFRIVPVLQVIKRAKQTVEFAWCGRDTFVSNEKSLNSQYNQIDLRNMNIRFLET